MRTVYTLIGLLLISCVSIAVSQSDYYVDPSNGNDAWDGLSPTYVSGLAGPKATVTATITVADTNDVLHLADAVYSESVVFDKSLAMRCGGNPSFQNLTVTNNSNLSLNTSIEVTGSLTLNGGLITNYWNSQIVITGTSPSALNIISGSINGRVVRTIPANSTESFQFTDINTVLIPDGTQPTTVVSVSAVQGEQPPYVTQGQAINRYYYVWSSNSISGSLWLSYDESELNGISENDLTPYCWTPGATQWRAFGGVLNAADNYVAIGGAPVDNWSKWTLGSLSNPLPIQLANFSAFVSNESDVQLNWGTISETNNYGFYIQQRHSSSNEFVDVSNSFVQGHGTTLEPQDYSWTHTGVPVGIYYYRLKQVDLNGTIHFSDGREVTVLSPTSVGERQTPTAFNLAQNYPNPFNPSTQIQFTVDKAGYTTLTVFDVLGRQAEILFAGTAEPGKLYSANFDASHLTNGTYFYKLANGGQTSLKKMLLLK